MRTRVLTAVFVALVLLTLPHAASIPWLVVCVSVLGVLISVCMIFLGNFVLVQIALIILYGTIIFKSGGLVSGIALASGMVAVLSVAAQAHYLIWFGLWAARDFNTQSDQNSDPDSHS